MVMKTGIIGCGNMGGGMARRLHELDQHLVCHDPDKAVRDALAAFGAPVVETSREAAAAVDVLILSLPTADIVEQVMGDIADSLRPNTVVVDCSTSKPATSQQLSAMAGAHGFHFLDAPVSGGPAAAINGTMTMLIGGEAAALESIRPVLDRLTSRIVHVGKSGAGHAAKIANNLLCAANLVLVGEAVRLAESCGVSAADLLQGVNAGSGRSGVSEVNYPRWILNDHFDSGFTMGLMRKDVRLALELAEQSGTALPGFDGIAALWANSRQSIPDTADFNRMCHYQSSRHD